MNDRNFLYVLTGLAAITALLLLSMLLFHGGFAGRTGGVQVERTLSPQAPSTPPDESPAPAAKRHDDGPAETAPRDRVLTVTLAGMPDPAGPGESATVFRLFLFDRASKTAREFGPFETSPVEIKAREGVWAVFARARAGGVTLFSPILDVDLSLDDVRIGLMLRKNGCLLSLRTENDDGFFGRIELHDDRSVPLLALPSHEGRADLVLPEGLYRLLVRGPSDGPPLLSNEVPLRDRDVSLKLVVDPKRPAVETLRDRNEDPKQD